MRHLARWLFVTVFLLALAAVPARPDDAEAPARRPNVVFLLADDLGWRDTSATGSTFYETPNLDRLARRGMSFSNAYAANPLCSPTRASILTGLYPCRVGITTPNGHIRAEVLESTLPRQAAPDQKAVTPLPRNRLRHEYVTIAENLKRAGYATGHFGKWHLGWEPYHPQSQGFDVAVPGGSYPGPPGSYFSPYRAPIYPDAPPGQHIDELTAAAAVRWIEEHRKEPFFLNYWLFSVHAPHDGGRPDLVAKYRKKADPASPQRNPIMGAMVETMDAAVGRIIDTIDRLGLADDTIIIFTSDNGGITWERADGEPVTSNAPLRNGKASIYEGGTREPLIVAWPGRIQPGSKSDALVSSIDHHPTILDLVGLKPPSDLKFDGLSIAPVLLGTGTLPREAIFCHFPHAIPASLNRPATSVRQGDWKLIRFYADGPDQRDRFELYNLAEDPGETTNQADSHPQRVRALAVLIDEHLKDTGALVPVPNPAYDRTTGRWQSGHAGTRITVADAQLVVTSTANDPFIVARGLTPARGPFVLEFQMKSTGHGPGQVFWSNARNAPFTAASSAKFDIRHDDAWHEYRVAIPAETGPRALRLDPGTGPGTIRFASLTLRNGVGMVVHDWGFFEPPPAGEPAPEARAGTERPGPPGVVIDHSPAASLRFIGSPSLAVLPNGDYVASHDFFSIGNTGNRTRVFGSTDRGRTWQPRAELTDQWWSTLFVHRGKLYLMGTTHAYGACVIRRSEDGGRTWTTPKDEHTGILLPATGRYHCAPVPVVKHDGRIWRALEDAQGPGGWGSHFRAFMMSAPVEADLLQASSWVSSNAVGRDASWLDGRFGGWLEGNAVVTPSGGIVDLLRVDVPAGMTEKAAMITISPDGKTAQFDPKQGFIDFPGGAKKFTVRFDPDSRRYWTLTNAIPEPIPGRKPASVRNTLAVAVSSDLKHWDVRQVILSHPDVVKHGFQYVDWQFDGPDLIAAVRTAHDDPQGGARNNHDANYLTFHRIPDFRRLAAEHP